jgi:hypothetical protein
MSKPLRTRKKEEHHENTSPSIVRRGWSVMRYLVTSELAHRFRQVHVVSHVFRLYKATA